MPRFVIERDIPDIGTAEREALREAAHKSNSVLAEMRAERKNIQWEHSYVADNKTFCIYIADNEGLIHEHAKRSGFPATKVTQLRKIIDPTTAEG
jgi:cell division inhibitor SulA